MVCIEESCERCTGTASADDSEISNTNQPSYEPLLQLQTVENPSLGEKMDDQTDKQVVQWSITMLD